MGLFSKVTTERDIADALHQAAPFLNPRVVRFATSDAVVVDALPSRARCLSAKDGHEWSCDLILLDDVGDPKPSWVPSRVIGGRVTKPEYIAIGMLQSCIVFYRDIVESVSPPNYEDLRAEGRLAEAELAQDRHNEDQVFAHRALRLLTAAGV